ncbi:hypothetical protein [Nonomuraea sp. NPDC048916]|uniref:hypothetical protein n=1 Tax=Nonomuraea sp. NPDC048916 TaxID=3154232 RepID=UPI0033D3E922
MGHAKGNIKMQNLRKQQTPPPAAARSQTQRSNGILRRLTHAAVFAVVRGLAYALGTGIVSLAVWWLTHR